MKHITKKIAIVAMVAFCATSTMFAKGRFNDSSRNFGRGNNNCCYGGGNFQARTQLVGQVDSVDTSKGLLTVTNADGKNIKVSINPFTRIRIIDETNNRFTNIDNASVKTDDIKKGDWVSVSAFNTDTSTLSAAMIAIRR